MKKFITYILTFFAMVWLIDCAFGVGCKYLCTHAKGGDTRIHHYINKECTDDILIMGSSRARHHYVPSILSDSLGANVYNCGVDGYGIIFMYARLLMMTDRYTPKLIIYDLTPDFDFDQTDNLRYLGYMNRYYDEEGIRDIIDLVSPSENIKLKCKLYRYNSSFVKLLTDNIAPLQLIGDRGYDPIYEKMSYETPYTLIQQKQNWDLVKKECMDRFVSLCKEKGIKLIFVFSPYASGEDNPYRDVASLYAENNRIPLLNFYSDPNFSRHWELFGDTSHLNDDGARQFTSIIATLISMQ